MTGILVLLRRAVADETGATAIEYSLLLALLAMAILSAVAGVGGAIFDLFSNPALRAALG